MVSQPSVDLVKAHQALRMHEAAQARLARQARATPNNHLVRRIPALRHTAPAIACHAPWLGRALKQASLAFRHRVNLT